MNKSRTLEIKKIVIENIESSTSHGIPNIFRNKSITLKILWIISLMVSSGYCVYCLSKNFKDFFDYKTNTQIKYDRVSQIEFPAVSFCNQYSYNVNSKSNLIELSKFGFSQLSDFIFETENILNYGEFMELASYFLQNQTITYKDKLEYIGFTLDYLLINCKFNSNKCSKSDFETFYSPKFGFCYKFNGNQTKGIRKIGMTGKKNGLSLELYIGEPTVEYDIYKTSGIELFIHNWTNMPSQQDTISLSGGFETNIATNQIFMKKKSKPYSNCIENIYSASSFNSDLYTETIRLYKKYQQKECLNICYHKDIKKKCGCYDPDFFYAESNQFCSFDIFRECVLNHRKIIGDSPENIECFKNCPEECDSVKYFNQVSHSNFPSPFYKNILMKYDEALNESLKRGFVFENLDKSVLSVNIYYDDIAITTIEEIPAKTVEQLVAEVGGFLGLCIGISFLSVVEILDTIIKIILLFLKEKKIIAVSNLAGINGSR